MSKDVFQGYHRGFLGRVLVPVEQPAQDDQIFRQLKNLQYNSNAYTLQDSVPVFNEDVEVLYAQLIKRTVSTGSAKFHDEILMAALPAFGTYSFLEWLEIQSQIQGANFTHSKFLFELLNFLRTGKRNMMLETWEGLLDSAALSSPWESVLDEALKMKQEGFELNTVENAILQWCRWPNGITDLLVSLHVMFGR